MDAATSELATYLNSLETVSDPFTLKRLRDMILALPDAQQPIATVSVAECTTDYASLSVMTMLLMDVIHKCEDEDAYWVGFDMLCCIVTRPFVATDPAHQVEADYVYKLSYNLCLDIIETGLEALDDPDHSFSAALSLINDCYDRNVTSLLPDMIGMVQNIISDMSETGQLAAHAMLTEALTQVTQYFPTQVDEIQIPRPAANDPAYSPSPSP